ncbi:hypothetical protein PHYSODRAFT_261286 [Phytophthora sojae]|uniref:Uncharacterized protein n=1 Tax=Phytophthora sojae (strain P6497) TaxID=1094619 RepID=G4ZDP4_PHYSP|nr:hypothetical protein PHYSODRAFT_261286 [Phytophthora sojae]EGZ18383.1 hypothetical protein PHYSODRAFT_261286 [Phytophthora sojae]|eukprot:XP_009527441.1 hypothetical protein PHYSODRAFT_261286 [Phytophthora sojae]
MCRTVATLFTPPTDLLAVLPPSELCFSFPASKAAAIEAPTKQEAVQRTSLKFVLSAEGIRFTDLAFVEEVTKRVAELKRSAAAAESKSNNTLLAQRTLKFRRIE